MGFKPKMYDSFGKIRTRYDNDLLGFAQWVGRKIRNHDPMSERDTGRGKRTYLNQDAKPKVGEPLCGDGRTRRGAGGALRHGRRPGVRNPGPRGPARGVRQGEAGRGGVLTW